MANGAIIFSCALALNLEETKVVFDALNFIWEKFRYLIS